MIKRRKLPPQADPIARLTRLQMFLTVQEINAIKSAARAEGKALDEYARDVLLAHAMVMEAPQPHQWDLNELLPATDAAAANDNAATAKAVRLTLGNGIALEITIEG